MITFPRLLPSVAVLSLCAIAALAVFGAFRSSHAAVDTAVAGVGAGPLADVADSAGTSAGMAEFCNIDPAPIHAALNSLLQQQVRDHARRHDLWLAYHAAEADSVVALSHAPAVSCTDIDSEIRDTIHDITVHPGSGDDQP